MVQISDSIKLAPPWSSPAEWHEANCTLNLLIQLHRLELHQSVALAQEVEVRLKAVFPIMGELCASTCPWCPDPCCLVANVWFDFRDLLFIHLTVQQVPPTQLLRDLKGVCSYLGTRGCTLPRITRPWVCTWYMCSPQKAKLREKTSVTQTTFRHEVEAIGVVRKEMEVDFIRVVS